MPLNTISPLDGRYKNKTAELAPIFSEAGLTRYRLLVEVEYLIALGEEIKIKEVKRLNDKQKVALRTIYLKFNKKDAKAIKKIEATTNHDVKAVEYFLKNKIQKNKILNNLPLEFVHFSLTSEDINNLAFSLMLKAGVEIYAKNLKELLNQLKRLAKKNQNIALLSLTHGQPASPTTIGKETAVFYLRLKTQLDELKKIKLKGKFGGAVGNWNAQIIAYPEIDWTGFSQKFVEKLGLKFNPLTTQIEPHDTLAQVYHNIVRINNIIKDLDQDIWLYISRGIFSQIKVKGEVGSSTMPHKINPIDFENSEGNIGVANAILEQMASKLAVSRMQRDLSDSAVLRNQGVALGYSLLAIKSTLKGLSKLKVNRKRLQDELEGHWEVLAEPIQVVLRKIGYPKPYEALKELTQGEKITKALTQNNSYTCITSSCHLYLKNPSKYLDTFHNFLNKSDINLCAKCKSYFVSEPKETLEAFINKLKIDQKIKKELLKLTPNSYIGLASDLVDQYLK